MEILKSPIASDIFFKYIKKRWIFSFTVINKIISLISIDIIFPKDLILYIIGIYTQCIKETIHKNNFCLCELSVCQENFYQCMKENIIKYNQYKFSHLFIKTCKSKDHYDHWIEMLVLNENQEIYHCGGNKEDGLCHRIMSPFMDDMTHCDKCERICCYNCYVPMFYGDLCNLCYDNMSTINKNKYNFFYVITLNKRISSSSPSLYNSLNFFGNLNSSSFVIYNC